MSDLSEVRKRAWATRREKYGAKGHGGYVHERGENPSLRTMRNLIAKLVNEGVVSEGQAAKAMMIPRIEVRKICDEVRSDSRNS